MLGEGAVYEVVLPRQRRNLSIDIYDPKLQVAIEVDGPDHFTHRLDPHGTR